MANPSNNTDTSVLPTASADGLPAAIMLAFLGTAGIFYVNILAALVSGLVDGLNYSSALAGYVASANVYGAAFGAFLAVFAVGRIRWRKAALFALISLMVIDAASTQISSSNILIPTRFIHGIVGGFLVGIVLSVIARTENPSRTFGMLLVIQAGIGGLGLMLLPGMVPTHGTPILFWALFAFTSAAALMLPFIPVYPPKDKTRQDTSKQSAVNLKPLVLALIGIFLYQASNMGLAAYMIELGRSYSLQTAQISAHIGIAHWVAVLGALLVYILATKFGRLIPMVSGFILTIAGMSVLHFSETPVWFLIGNIIVSTTWAFLLPYILGICAEFDANGRMATLSGFCSKMGLASGPLTAAFILEDQGYDLILNLTITGIAISAAILLLPAQQLDQART
ncbi:MAG: MFS transporter [Kordiimonas sp.]